MKAVLTTISTPTCQIYPKFTLRLLDLPHLLAPPVPILAHQVLPGLDLTLALPVLDLTLALLDLLRLLDPPDLLDMNGIMKSAALVPLEYGSTTTKSTTTQGKNPQ